MALLALGAGMSVAMGQEVAAYGVASWEERLGNHRAVVDVSAQADAVRLHIPWRLHRYEPDKHDIVVIDATTGERVANMARVKVDRESADLAFQPKTSPGRYFVYYLPYSGDPVVGYADDIYTRPTGAPDAAWAARFAASDLAALPKASLVRLEANGAFNRFDPMEVVANRGEVDRLLARRPGAYLVFPEDRREPIRMQDELPVRWVKSGPATKVIGSALRNEFFTYQLGVFAARQELKGVKVRFEALKGEKGAIPASAMRCFNMGGVGPLGERFVKRVDVPLGRVQALWCGVQAPRDAKPGTYRGSVIVSAEGVKPTRLPVALTIGPKVLEDHGDSEPWRGSRLRWLDSTLGADDEVVAPFTPLKLNGRTVTCLGREVKLGSDGLPASIRCGSNPVLKSPARFAITAGGKPVSLKPVRFRFTKRTPGGIGWTVDSSGEGLSARCIASMEFDGHLSYAVELSAKEEIALDDVALELPFCETASTYLMGAGRVGGNRPKSYSWKWEGPYDSFWMGDVHAGLHVELRGGAYHGPMLNLYHPAPPESWFNGGRGGLQVSGERAALARAASGPRKLAAGQKLRFEFAFLVTPVKPLDWRAHFKTRYHHGWPVVPDDAELKLGVNVLNLHHATEYNPYINYPLAAVNVLKPLVDQMHAKGVKTKIYFTIRELTNHTAEFWALRSLGYEVLADGGGRGMPWLWEHAVDHYAPAWVMSLGHADVDAAVVTSGISRWTNFYVEGLQWMSRNAKIDGLYLDDVTYDRSTLKRMRKVMARTRPGSMIDLHSNTGFSIGPANQYAEFLPYVDRIWFGESFRYQTMTPDQWLTEVSGIPFGVGGEMLQGGGNPWRGALYGMTNRMGWGTENVQCDPRPVWRVWDAFGIADSKMIGYWEPSCPVRTDAPDVLATVYAKKGKALVCLASWAPSNVSVRLTVNWQALGINPAKAKLKAVESAGVQPAAEFLPGDSIPVEPRKGWMLVLE